jgi:hypothetical protein
VTAPAYIRGRIRPDLDAQAASAARAVLDDGMTRKAAGKRYGVGWKRLAGAIAKLRAERAARSTP